MTTHIKDIVNNIKNIYMADSSLESLMDFERVIDELDLYVFENWNKGELVEGPIYEKYFVKCTFMWPYKLMPDPRGGERLLDYDCEVRYRKDVLFYPVKVNSPDDFKPGTQVPCMAKKPVWLVEIIMPKQLMQDINRGSLELEADTVDVEDIESAYETGVDDDVYKSDDEQTQGTVPNEQQIAPPFPA